MVTITGVINNFGFYNDNSSKDKIIEVLRWGNVTLDNIGGSFYNCINLNIPSVVDVPNITNQNQLTQLFNQCSSLSTVNNINSWNTSVVKNLTQTFSNTQFNQDISSWDVSNVTTFNGTFSRSPFNQDIGSWDVSSAITLTYMLSLIHI